MPIVKHDCVIEDAWRPLDGRDLTEIDAGEAVVLSLEEWRAHGPAASERFAQVGVSLAPGEAVEEIAGDLPLLSLVSLTFPKFNDGRAFSQARLLRERLCFTGEVRAVGHVIRDQFLFLQRSGFDAVAVKDAKELDAWITARQRFTGYYQPALDRSEEEEQPTARTTQAEPALLVSAASESVAAIWAY